MKPRIIFDSISEMLTPDALSELLGARVDAVSLQPFEVQHRSANVLREIWAQAEGGRVRLILKEFQPKRDWVMRLTHDTLTREAMLFVHGIYAQMPPGIVVPVIAAARNRDTWATLMRDVSAELVTPDRMVEVADARVLLENLAALHAHFWNRAELQNPALGLSSLYDFLTILAPARVQAEMEAGRAHPVLEMAVRGWKQFDESAPTDVREIIHMHQASLAPLMQELDAMPRTLVHSDYKLDNLGIARRPSGLPDRSVPATVMLDWQDATRGAGVMDLGYFLALNARRLPFSNEEAMQIYMRAIGARGQWVTRRQIEIGLLAGGALRLLWLMALNQPTELDWWYDLVRRVG